MEHSHWLDDEQLALMAERGTFYVPTLIVNERCAPAACDPVSGIPSGKAAWLLKAQAEKWDTLARAKRAGVKIVAGTDAGCLVYHGENACELEELVKGGFTPMEAIVAATRTAADCLDMLKEIGTVEPSKFADLVIVDGDPLADIRILKDKTKIAQVFKGGKSVWKTKS
jgi:imidazolonepropionase-like amidohydrolase